MPRRGNNIYKRKDGRWEARYMKGISAYGKKLYGSVYGRTYTEAKEKQALFLKDCLSSKRQSTISLSVLMHEWLNHIENDSVDFICVYGNAKYNEIDML